MDFANRTRPSSAGNPPLFLSNDAAAVPPTPAERRAARDATGTAFVVARLREDGDYGGQRPETFAAAEHDVVAETLRDAESHDDYLARRAQLRDFGYLDEQEDTPCC